MKAEVELKDVFKNLKPSLLYHQTGKKKKGIDVLENKIALKEYNKEVFYLTKPFTGITKKEAEDLWENYLAIRKFRKERKEPTIKPCRGERLFPLDQEKYDNIAKKIWHRANQPTFGIRRIDKVIFGNPITIFSNYVNWKSYSAPVIIERTIGIKPVRGLLGHVVLIPTIDVDSENNLKSWKTNKYRPR